MSSLTTVFRMAADFFAGQAPGSPDVPFTFEVQEWTENSFDMFNISHVVPGLTGDSSDFVPTDAESSFLRESNGFRWPQDRVGGGFGETRLSLLCGYGTGVRVVPDEEIDALISAGDIHHLLLEPPHHHLRNALKDRFVFRVCQSAITQDNVKFEAINEKNLDSVDFGDGFHVLGNVGLYWMLQYEGNNEERPKLFVATLHDADYIKDTIQHELLHYLFDKSTNVLGNVEVGAKKLKTKLSEDHLVIEPIMERLKTQALCKIGLIMHLGQISWSASGYKFETIIGDFVTCKIQRGIEEPIGFDIRSVGGVDIAAITSRYNTEWDSNNHNVIMSLLDDPDFARAFVAAQLIPLLSHPLFPELESIPLLFSPEMYQDMAFLHAQRYAMYVHGIYELSLISKRTGKKMKDLFTSEDTDNGATLRNFGWHTRMDAFFTEFFEALITDPMEGVLAIERRLRKP